MFGVENSASALAVIIFNVLCSALTGIIVYEIGKEIDNEKSGFIAGVIWAFCPYIAILPYLLWDTCLSALILGAAVLLTLRLRSDTASWARCGTMWGFAALVNPALISPLPFIAVFLASRRQRLKHVSIMLAATGLLILPWTVRNYLVFHQLFLIRSNGLAEVYFANGGFSKHPLGPSMEYQRLGEAAFTAEAGREALHILETTPLSFLRHSVERAFWFWFYPANIWPLTAAMLIAAIAGLVIVFRNSISSGYLLALVISVYPIIFYASQVVSRYRHPLEPVLFALAGVTLSRVASLRQAHRSAWHSL
jgi:hypothetical protein